MSRPILTKALSGIKIIAAYYLLLSCVFLLGYAGWIVYSQWADVESGDLLLLVFFWIIPCLAGIFVVVSNRLYVRGRSGSAAQDT